MSALAPVMPLSARDGRADEVMVPMSDGTRLATDVYLPSSSGPHPTLVTRVPYDKGGDIALMPAIASRLLDRGYAVVVQDVRGKARSEGATEPFVHEVADGHDTLEWVESRSWSQPGVGMFGDSYYGWTQWAAAASGHRALRAIAPRVTSTRIGDDWMYRGGAFCLAAMADWAALTWVDRRLYEYVPDWSVRPLSELLPAWLDGRRSPALDRWMAWGPGNPRWNRGVFAAVTAARIRIPALHLGGWWDIFHRGQLADWASASASAWARQQLVMDAVDHQWERWRPLDAPAGDARATGPGFDAFMSRYLDPVAAFMDREIRGLDAERREAPVRFHVAGAGWRDSSSWPPPEAGTLELWLGDAVRSPIGPEGGVLTAVPEASRHTVRWTHDPADLVPSLDADVWWPLLEFADDRDVQVRGDVLTFTGEPVSRDVDLAGPVRAGLAVGASRSPYQVTAKLVDVAPDGRARRIAEGVRALHVLDVQPAVGLDLGHTAYRVARGHRIRLEVAASTFPRYAPIPGAAGAAHELRLRTGGGHGSRLQLSVLN